MAEEVVTGCAVAFGVKPERFGSSLGCTVAVYSCVSKGRSLKGKLKKTHSIGEISNPT
jgi:hypothetical protein